MVTSKRVDKVFEGGRRSWQIVAVALALALVPTAAFGAMPFGQPAAANLGDWQEVLGLAEQFPDLLVRAALPHEANGLREVLGLVRQHQPKSISGYVDRANGQFISNSKLRAALPNGASAEITVNPDRSVRVIYHDGTRAPPTTVQRELQSDLRSHPQAHDPYAGVLATGPGRDEHRRYFVRLPPELLSVVSPRDEQTAAGIVTALGKQLTEMGLTGYARVLNTLLESWVTATAGSREVTGAATGNPEQSFEGTLSANPSLGHGVRLNVKQQMGANGHPERRSVSFLVQDPTQSHPTDFSIELERTRKGHFRIKRAHDFAYKGTRYATKKSTVYRRSPRAARGAN